MLSIHKSKRSEIFEDNFYSYTFGMPFENKKKHCCLVKLQTNNKFFLFLATELFSGYYFIILWYSLLK